MAMQNWNTMSKQERAKILKSAGLLAGLSQLKWSGLQKSERKKIEKAMKSRGKGWHEEKKEVLTGKGIEKKAPIHREVAIKKEAGQALNVPMQKKKSSYLSDYLNEKINYGGFIMTRGEAIADMQRTGAPQKNIDLYMMGAKTIEPEKNKSAHEEKAQEFDWQKIYKYPNLQHVYLGMHGVFERLQGKDKERFIKDLSEDVKENGSWEKAEEDAKEFFKTKGFYYDKDGKEVFVGKETPTTPTKTKSLAEIDDTHNIYTIYIERPLVKGTDTAETLPVYYDKAVFVQGLNTDEPPVKVLERTHPIEQIKEGLWRYTPDTSIEIIVTSFKIAGYEVVKEETGRTHMGETVPVYYVAKKRAKKASKKEPPFISDPKRKLYDPKFEEAESERMRAEEKHEREWNIQEAEEYIGAQGVNPITGESMGRDWDNVVREYWIESEAHNDEFNELVTEVMLSGATEEDYDAWKAKFGADPQGTIQKLKGLISKNAVKTKDWQEIEKEADEYIENTCNIKGVRYPKTECRRMSIAVSSGWKSAGIMLKREAQDEAKKFRAQGFRVRVEKVI